MHKHISLVISALLFSLLFYQQQLGLNFPLFSIVVIIFLVTLHFKKFEQRRIRWYTIAYLISSSFVFIYNSPLTVIASIIGFFALIGSLQEQKSSIYTKLLNGFFSTIASSFSFYYNNLLTETEAFKKRKINYLYWFKMIGIPTIVLLIFTILYRSANPFFDEIIQSIDLSFINLQWILFSALGYFLFLNLRNSTTIEPLTSLDLQTPNALNSTTLKEQSKSEIIQENQLGNVLFILLNTLILFFLITDVFYVKNIDEFSASSLSKTVHQGIYALITSIVIAISIILYFFRGNLNFYEKNKTLTGLAVTWILLNIGLVISTAYKNYLYVYDFGFTYKRIGVFIYLNLSLIGLITTYIKVNYKFNLWYLLRKNLSLAFVTLILCSTVNWDKLITIYNIQYAKNTDIEYLIQLSDNNTFLLKNYKDNLTRGISTQQKAVISMKYNAYLHKLSNSDWQELVFDNLNLEMHR